MHWVARLGRLPAMVWSCLVALGALGCLVPATAQVVAGETWLERLPWMPEVGLDLAFRLDGLGLLFAALVLGMGLLVILYARYYMPERDSLGRLYGYLLLFMGSMLGVVLSENLLLLLVFWELTSLSSFLLISFWWQRRDARQGARMALTVTGAGGLSMLGGILLLGRMVGSHELSVVLASGDAIRAHPLYFPALLLILLGAFTKSAQFPFHFWLPHAMAAPTPVSAYLHSATMVKAGVFLLARLFPALSGTPEWFWLVGGVGLATLLVGAVTALFMHDLKGLLAYSTISHLGLITLLFGLGTSLGALAGVFHIINHALFKASLFMAAGIIDHETGTRDMRRLCGLWRFMPHTATLAMVAAAAMAGVPLFNGFLSKEMFFAETVVVAGDLRWGWLLPGAATLAGIFSVAYSVRFIHTVFFDVGSMELDRTPHEPARWMKVPVEVLVALCLLVGIFPGLTVEPILAMAAASTLQGPLPAHSIAIWHGFSPAFWMSVIALAGGGMLYLGRRPFFVAFERLGGRPDGGELYHRLLDALFAFARKVTRLLDPEALQPMMLVWVLWAVVLGRAAWGQAGTQLAGPLAMLPVDGVSLLAALVLMGAAVGAVLLHRRRLTALVLTGAVGLVVSLIFVKFSAPDLALTQLSVEVVTMVLLLLALYFLPQSSPAESPAGRCLVHGMVAVLAGFGVAALAWAVLTRPYHGISDYFLANSLPGGGGKNVVNVILVDFRGFDTLGEITVLGLAGLGIYALLEKLHLKGPARDPEGRPWSPDVHPSIMAALTRLLLPLALMVSVFIFLRGHNLPGGGFIAGLITSVALIMQYMANGVRWSQARLPVRSFHPVMGAGLAMAALTGLGSLYFGHPFLTSAFGHVHWPLVGDFELASAMAFDLGVYLVVVGATLLILVRLGMVHGVSGEEGG